MGGAILLGWSVFLVALLPPWKVHLRGEDPGGGISCSANPCIRVEVQGDPRVEGIYFLTPGTTVEAFLPRLGVVRDRGGETACLGLLKDLQVLRLTAEGGCFVDLLSPRKAFLLGEPLDVNRASARDLTLLPGVGPVTARRIVDFRRRHGPLRGPEDLLRIRGLHARKVSRILPMVSFGRDLPREGKP
jgi:competence protein ComEA